MKKTFVILALFASSFINQSLAKDIPNKDAVFTRPWSVSSYGFLIFPSVLDLDEYIRFVQTKTHAQMQQYIQDSLSGFTSIGTSLYSSSLVTITENEAYHYAMNTYRIVQATGVIIRPISERECSVNYEFVLTLTPAYLNSTTYSNLQSGTFDANSMNKFATNPDTESTSLADFVGSTPYGHADTDPSECPGEPLPVAKTGIDKTGGSNSFKRDFSETDLSFKYAGPSSYGYKEKYQINNFRAARPFWGYGPSSCEVTGSVFNPITNTSYPTYTYHKPDYYLFWIKVYEGASWVVGTVCPPAGEN